jgi:hypothetical protein
MNAIVPAQDAAKGAEKVRITKRVQQAIDLLVTGDCDTMKDAAIKVGLHPDYLSRTLKKPQVKAFLERRSRETIAGLLPKAVATLTKLLNAESEHVQKDVAIHLLRLAGIEPASDGRSPLVNVNVIAGEVVGYRIDLTPKPNVIDVTPTDSASGDGNG